MKNSHVGFADVRPIRVIPAKAGIHVSKAKCVEVNFSYAQRGPGLRQDDTKGRHS